MRSFAATGLGVAVAQPVAGSVSSTLLTEVTKLIGVVRVVGDGRELSPSEVASEFGVSPATVRRWEDRGWIGPARRLPGSKHRRYTRQAVDEFRRRWEAGEFDQPADAEG